MTLNAVIRKDAVEEYKLIQSTMVDCCSELDRLGDLLETVIALGAKAVEQKADSFAIKDEGFISEDSTAQIALLRAIKKDYGRVRFELDIMGDRARELAESLPNDGNTSLPGAMHQSPRMTPQKTKTIQNFITATNDYIELLDDQENLPGVTTPATRELVS